MKKQTIRVTYTNFRSAYADLIDSRPKYCCVKSIVVCRHYQLFAVVLCCQSQPHSLCFICILILFLRHLFAMTAISHDTSTQFLIGFAGRVCITPRVNKYIIVYIKRMCCRGKYHIIHGCINIMPQKLPCIWTMHVWLFFALCPRRSRAGLKVELDGTILSDDLSVLVPSFDWSRVRAFTFRLFCVGWEAAAMLSHAVYGKVTWHNNWIWFMAHTS